MPGLVRLVLYVYGQPKLNISVSEILNRNQLKWLELNRFRSISVSINFGRFLVYQREGYWDFWNLNFNHILKQRNRATKRERERERERESFWTKMSDKERKENNYTMRKEGKWSCHGETSVRKGLWRLVCESLHSRREEKGMAMELREEKKRMRRLNWEV